MTLSSVNATLHTSCNLWDWNFYSKYHFLITTNVDKSNHLVGHFLLIHLPPSIVHCPGFCLLKMNPININQSTILDSRLFLLSLEVSTSIYSSLSSWCTLAESLPLRGVARWLPNVFHCPPPFTVVNIKHICLSPSQ